MGIPIGIPIKFFITNLSLESSSKLSTSLKLSHLLSSNLNLLLCSGVDTLTSRALANAKCTETYESDLVTSCESILDGIYCCIESFLCVYL